jgi:predicted GH43/DUF377 family glycosyl hydrolase
MTRLDPTLLPDPRRVIVRLFVPGEDAALVRTRAAGLVGRIAHLDDAEIERLLVDTLQRFEGRHHDLAATFQHHYDLVRHRVIEGSELSPAARQLVGAYFSHEYAVEAAALCNPSMVPHPDQSNLDKGQLRVAISLRQIGEGHVSSIGFATAVIGPGTRLDLADRSGPTVAGQPGSARHRRDLLAAGLADDGLDNEVSATVLASLPERFEDDEFDRALAGIPLDLLVRATAQQTVEQLRRTITASYAVTFPTGSALHQRVLWPTMPPESNGMEDARFVRFVDLDGDVSFRATYTAYDGRGIRARLLSTAELRRFEITPLRGPGARNKGMALFPRPVGGRDLALCRSDGETLGLTTLDEQHRWRRPTPLRSPRRGWGLVQIGNCGSPIETDHGWLVLTHGVGPMRRYAIGALLLDRDQPDQVIAELPGTLLDPGAHERDGYVPNVVYSCGALAHDGTLWLPYGISDARVGFACAPVAALIDAMEPDPGSLAPASASRVGGG